MSNERGLVIEVRLNGRVMYTLFLDKVKPTEFERVIEELEEIAYKLSVQEL